LQDNLKKRELRTAATLFPFGFLNAAFLYFYEPSKRSIIGPTAKIYWIPPPQNPRKYNNYNNEAYNMLIEAVKLIKLIFYKFLIAYK